MSSGIIATARRGAAEVSSNRFAWWCAAVVVVWGLAAALVYHNQGLTLSHYDAKGHLVVARRVFDSLTPTWRQIGAVWLPLPHLLNLLPVQVDWLYRTGASGVLISVLAFGLAAYAATRIVLHATGSRSAAILAVAIMASNPNLLYLQSTPMTEPLLLGLLMLTTWRLQVWVDEDTPSSLRSAGWALAGAALTRYEAWPFMAAAIAFAAFARHRHGTPLDVVLRRTARLTAYPVCAVLAFVINSRLSTGAWFVTGGFYVPDPRIQGKVFQVTASRLVGRAPARIRHARLHSHRRTRLRTLARATESAAVHVADYTRAWPPSPRCRGMRSSRDIPSGFATWCRWLPEPRSGPGCSSARCVRPHVVWWRWWCWSSS